LVRFSQLDATILRTTVPAASLTDLSLNSDMYILKFDETAVEKMLNDNPSYSRDIIPAGTYKGTDEDMNTVGQTVKPRTYGITMMFDYGMGLVRQEDWLNVVGRYRAIVNFFILFRLLLTYTFYCKEN